MEFYLTQAFSETVIIHLSDLEIGEYNVIAMKGCKQKYGEKFVLLLEVDDCLLQCYTNWDIEEYISKTLPMRKRQCLQKHNLLYLENEHVATVTNIGKRLNRKGNMVSCCRFKFSPAMQVSANIEEDE